MQTVREQWTDERLDGFRERVDERFDRVDERLGRVEKRLDRVEDDIKTLNREMNARFDSMQRSMMQAVVALSVGMLAGFGGLAGLIATQL